MFNKGDVVALKSGGPRMTVDKVEDGRAVCVWFDKSTEKRGVFDVELLAPSQRAAVGVMVSRGRR